MRAKVDNTKQKKRTLPQKINRPILAINFISEVLSRFNGPINTTSYVLESFWRGMRWRILLGEESIQATFSAPPKMASQIILAQNLFTIR